MKSTSCLAIGSVVMVFTIVPWIHAQKTEQVTVSYRQKSYPLCPEMLERLPEIPSPFTSETGQEVLIASTKDSHYCIIPVTLIDVADSNHSAGRNQRETDLRDFPALSTTGLHSVKELDQTRMITGRSISEITDLARPGRLSGDGFMGADEDIISVLKGDNVLVKRLGLTHPQMAKTLFHVVNLIQIGREMENYLSWERHTARYPWFLYHKREIHMKVEFTKGGQESIFDDGLQGALTIYIWRELNPVETAFLKSRYPRLDDEQMAALIKHLSSIQTGEMVPYYIMRYGFYEGHTDWRSDPVAMACIFGLKTLEEIERAFPGELDTIMTDRFTRENGIKRGDP
jgi:hypothetical protein